MSVKNASKIVLIFLKYLKQYEKHGINMYAASHIDKAYKKQHINNNHSLSKWLQTQL